MHVSVVRRIDCVDPYYDFHHGLLGIVGMEERVRLADGRFSLVSRPGGGTQVDVWVPIPQAGGENT